MLDVSSKLRPALSRLRRSTALFQKMLSLAYALSSPLSDEPLRKSVLASP